MTKSIGMVISNRRRINVSIVLNPRLTDQNEFLHGLQRPWRIGGRSLFGDFCELVDPQGPSVGDVGGNYPHMLHFLERFHVAN